MKQLLTFISLCFFGVQSAQTADEVLEKINAKYHAVRDYSVHADITADIPMLKIMPNKGTIYFKQKDKIKIEAKGITVLPKQGFTEINTFLEDKSGYMAFFGDTLRIGSVVTRLINIIPNNSSGEMILIKIWVDLKNSVIMRSQITTKTNGSIHIDYMYKEQLQNGLPSQLIFEIDVKTFKIPKSIAGDINQTDQKDRKKSSKTKGLITINLRDYKLNIGLQDEVFGKK